jgi:two-component system, NarL family, nitrate/nitrite response regulator NarL
MESGASATSPTPSARPFRVVLIDDHDLLRVGLRSLLGMKPGWQVAGEAMDGVEGVHLALRENPDLVITDMLMADLNGIEVGRRLRAAGYAGGIVLLTSYVSPELETDAKAAGLTHVVSKNAGAPEILAVLERLAAAPHPGAVPAEDPNSSLAMLASLTPREREVLGLIAHGHASKQIAEQLGCSPATVDVHRHRLLKKLQSKGPADLTRIAVRCGLVGL